MVTLALSKFASSNFITIKNKKNLLCKVNQVPTVLRKKALKQNSEAWKGY
jgi:hypothetical protein